MTDPLPADVLEKKAVEQRSRLHNSVAELRTTVRESFDVKRTARENLWPAASALSLVALVFGYSLASIFTAD